MAPNLTTKVFNLVPDSGAIIAGVLTSLILYHATTTILAWRRLAHFPGPPLAAFTNLWGFWAVARGQNAKVIFATQEKYGAVMRIGPTAIMIHDPETLWQINSARSAYDRGDWYAGLRIHPDGNNVLSETKTGAHDKRKARVVAGFSGKGAMDLEADIDSQVAALVKYIRVKVLNGQGDKLDFSRILRWFQLDLITLAAMGYSWGDLADETDHFQFLESVDWATPFLHSVTKVTWMRKVVFSKWFLRLLGPKMTDEEGLGRSLREMRAAVKAHFENAAETKVEGRQRSDMLSEWIKHGHDADQCEQDLAVQMPAGTDTTITAIRSILLHLLTSPTSYHKLKQELAEGIKAGRISQPVTNDQTKDLPYLQAVISEGLRMVPPALEGFPKVVPPGGDTIHGKFVPGGTEIWTNCVSMTRNPEIFGADSALFRPERFLEADAAHRSHMLKTIELLFGYGRWLCLGKTFAKIEISKVLVELLRVFDFQIINAEQPWKRYTYASSLIQNFDLRIWENPLDSN